MAVGTRARDAELDGPSDSSLCRRMRIRGAPRAIRLTGDKRIPRSLGGGALGLLVVVLFFFQLAGNSLAFLVMLGLAVLVLWFCIWTLVQLPIRPHFDQRWRPKRRIHPLDLSGWKELAAEIGGKVGSKRLPRLEGVLDGFRYRLSYHQRGGARTVATVRLPARLRSWLTVLPRRAVYGTPEDRETGDAGFDHSWHARCPSPKTARQLLGDRTRKWIEIAEPEELHAEGKKAWARHRGFTAEADRLWALLLSAVCLAERVRAAKR